MNKRYEIAGLFIRIVLGITFFIHGLTKFQDGISNTVGFFNSVGIPGSLAYVVAIIELVGGLLLILGLGTRWVSALLFIVMLGAMITVKFSAGFVGGYELDLALLAMALYLVISGSKVLSIDKLFTKESTY